MAYDMALYEAKRNEFRAYTGEQLIFRALAFLLDNGVISFEQRRALADELLRRAEMKEDREVKR
jgi:hypothetical protein